MTSVNGPRNGRERKETEGNGRERASEFCNVGSDHERRRTWIYHTAFRSHEAQGQHPWECLKTAAASKNRVCRRLRAADAKDLYAM